MYISQVKCFNSEFVHFMRTAFNPGFALPIAIVAKCEEIINLAQKNINLATNIGERKIASENFCLTSESSPPATSHCLVPLNGHQCVS